ncbi:MAG TPA: hypothetical protein PKX07_13380, partial [Aggregatilineales bacterium]|nr:hypothetical protein [Aggregatilineales bacterium]
MTDDFENDDLSWLRRPNDGDDDDSLDAWDSDFGADDAADAPSLGFTGDLDWRSSDPGEDEPSDEDLFGWMAQADSDASAQSMTGSLGESPDDERDSSGDPDDFPGGIAGDVPWRSDLDVRFDEQFGEQFRRAGGTKPLLDPEEVDALLDDTQAQPLPETDWLSDDTFDGQAGDLEGEDLEKPDWLTALEPDSSELAAPAPANAQLDSLFDDLDLSAFGDEPTPPTPTSPLIDDGSLPAWLENVEDPTPTD